MAKRIRTILAMALVMLLATSVAVAEQSPKAIVESIITKMQAAKSPVPVLDYVHWESAYEKLSDPEKAQMNVKSGAELKAFYSVILADPASYMKKQLNARMGEFPPEQREQMKAQVEQMMTMVNQRVAEMSERIAGTTYKIGEEKIIGDTAEVPLVTTYAGENKSDDIRFVRIDGKWYLPAVQMAQSGPPGPGAPAGAPAAPMGG